VGLRKPRPIITGIIITGIMAVSGPTGIIIALTGRAEVITRSQLVEYHFAAFGSGDLAPPILLRLTFDGNAAILAVDRCPVCPPQQASNSSTD